MAAIATSAVRAPDDFGPPGLYVTRSSRAGPAPEQRTPCTALFLGIGRTWGDHALAQGGAMLTMNRWDAHQFDSVFQPRSGGHLRAAVRGFFTNGGRRCVVAVQDAPKGSSGGDALVRALERGGVLEDRSDIDLVCVPDAVSGLVAADDQETVQAAVIAHCQETADRFAILDAPPLAGLAADAAVARLLRKAATLKSSVAALYFPWIAVDGVSRPVGDRELESLVQWRCASPATGASKTTRTYLPPCGHVAGLVARLDDSVGPHHPPANEVLAGVVDTSMQLSRAQHARISEGGINYLHGLRGAGIEVAGARTLDPLPPLQQLGTARVVIAFRRWLATEMLDLVFEPSTPRLLDVIRTRLVSHCLELQRAGALAGGDPAQAFFVKCDDETTSPDDRQSGRVVAQIGLAPSVAAEFVLVRLVRDAGGLTVSGLS